MFVELVILNYFDVWFIVICFVVLLMECIEAVVWVVYWCM